MPDKNKRTDRFSQTGNSEFPIDVRKITFRELHPRNPQRAEDFVADGPILVIYREMYEAIKLAMNNEKWLKPWYLMPRVRMKLVVHFWELAATVAKEDGKSIRCVTVHKLTHISYECWRRCQP